MATSWAQLSSSGSEANPSAWEDTVYIAGSALNTSECTLDAEVRAMFQDAWSTKICSDITLCAGGTEFKAHKLVLAAHSSFFRQKLGVTRVNVDVEPDILKLVLNFLYVGGVEVPKSSIPQVQDAADLLRIPVLQKHCLCAALTEQEVTQQNCLQMWEAGRQVKKEQLSSKGFEYALLHFQEVQYSGHFLKLTSILLKEFILHADLQTPSPDVKLSAAIKWTLHAPESRLQHLAEIMDRLPMSKMQAWLLQDTLHNPLIKENRDVCSRLQAGLKEQRDGGKKKTVSQQEVKRVLPPQPAPAAQSLEEVCVVTVGHRLYRDGKRQKPTDDVILCRIGEDIKVETIGKVGASHIPEGTKSVIHGRNLYVGGLGRGWDELWEYKLDDRSPATGRLVGRFKSRRQGHAMCLKDDQLYILGGCDGIGSCTASVEVYDTMKTELKYIGNIKHSNILHPSKSLNNLTAVADRNNIFVCGAYPSDDKGKPLYKHTAQQFSLIKEKITSSVTLSKQTEWSVYSLLLVDNNLILLARDYTAVISKQHIEQNHPHMCTYCDNYVMPNERCGVVLTPTRQHVLLLGGNPKSSMDEHYLYRASVSDILANTGPGWEKMQGKWPLGKSVIFLSNTMDVVKY